MREYIHTYILFEIVMDMARTNKDKNVHADNENDEKMMENNVLLSGKL